MTTVIKTSAGRKALIEILECDLDATSHLTDEEIDQALGNYCNDMVNNVLPLISDVRQVINLEAKKIGIKKTTG